MKKLIIIVRIIIKNLTIKKLLEKFTWWITQNVLKCRKYKIITNKEYKKQQKKKRNIIKYKKKLLKKTSRELNTKNL